ncbi:peptide-methionine (S)-S-oxide reductase MsrA [Myxococcota bacterium]|nr:peptide-methionine (S)-S-oxide reductase MsrA [Myxococcota bacterium]
MNNRSKSILFVVVSAAIVTIGTLSHSAENTAKATFGGGCFWCMEPPFDKLTGVISTISGYSGGIETSPTYDQVSSGKTGHTEVVQVEYDPQEIHFEELLEIFWKNIDPFTADQQFCDRGSQYRSAIYAHDSTQLEIAVKSREKLEASDHFNMPIVTEIEPLKAFYPAEDYHHDYYLKNPIRYRYYRARCGRDTRLRQIWDSFLP